MSDQATRSSDPASDPAPKTAPQTDSRHAPERATRTRESKPGATIVLDDVTKHYPGQAAAAVDSVSMTIPAGEIVVFVGPSGCGKTTTMKMINRLIEPTSGRILIDDTDVLGLDVDQHRRNIGYVIQQTGLIPHMTIAENIGLVPRMLKWKKAEIADRVEELLETVGLPASQYAKRYPRQLSGGQQQRIGVARALAADPPVMLMDEPFGATDPITRERLQNEFLRLQTDLKKTIVFVTHDFDEALKMGDRIAVLREQSVIAQYDTPTAILADPADDYVSSFIGSGGAAQAAVAHLRFRGQPASGTVERERRQPGRVERDVARLPRLDAGVRQRSRPRLHTRRPEGNSSGHADARRRDVIDPR